MRPPTEGGLLGTATVTRPPIDSRQYRFIYGIRSLADLPEDFPVPETNGGFRFGVFLPQDELRLFGRRYPARIVMLCPGSLVIRAHPSAGEAPTFVPLEAVQFVESGHILLYGWLRLVSNGSDRTLLYNTCASRAVDELLLRLREDCLPSFTGIHRPSGAGIFGPPSDLKMHNAESTELDPQEQVLLRFFSPVVSRNQKWWGYKRELRSPADLVLLTDRRLLWITDRYQDRYERYGTVCRYAGVGNVVDLACHPGEQGTVLTVQFRWGGPWRIPISSEMQAELHSFVDAARHAWGR